MEYDQKMFSLLSDIDRMIEDREQVHRVEREILEGEDTPFLDVYAVNPLDNGDPDITVEVEKICIIARDMAHKHGYKTSSIRPAKDRRMCRRFDIYF